MRTEIRKAIISASIIGLTALYAWGTTACGSSDIGEECDHEGKVGGECVSEGVCGRDNGGSLVCLKQCTTQFDCGSGECGTITGTTLKGCRARKL